MGQPILAGKAESTRGRMSKMATNVVMDPGGVPDDRGQAEREQTQHGEEQAAADHGTQHVMV